MLGVNVLAWGILGLTTASASDRWSVVRLCISSLHFVVGALFITRKSVREHGKIRDLLIAIPSLLACGAAFKFAPSPATWPAFAQVVFAVATFFAIASLICLGRNFAVLPALRSVTTIGPYAWLRHPAYLGEAGMVLACWLAGPNWISGTACLLLVPTLMIRITAEERVLRLSPEYQSYVKSVRWRLVPGLW